MVVVPAPLSGEGENVAVTPAIGLLIPKVMGEEYPFETATVTGKVDAVPAVTVPPLGALRV